MCTAMSLISKQKEVFLGRNMDFSYELNPEIYICPRNYEWQSMVSNAIFKNKYQFIGTGQNIGKIVFADGMNENGLGVAVLYFKDYAVYDKEIIPSKSAIASLELVNYLLGMCRNVFDVIQKVQNIQLLGMEDPITNTVAPLHWIVADKTGYTITIEKTMNGMEIINNPVGVLANSPDFSWQLTNLRNYMNLSSIQMEESKLDNLILTPFGQGGGSLGLPGDYTSPSRFVRIAFQKNFLKLPDTRSQTAIECFNVMKSVFIPKGIVMTKRNTSDYTQYTVFMNLNTGDYYFNTYYNQEIKMANIYDKKESTIISLGKIKHNIY